MDEGASRTGSLLHCAVLSSFQASLIPLLSDGADVDGPDEHQRSPLILAVELDSTKAVRLLVKAGASLKFYDDQNQTALMYAASAGNMEMIRVLDQSEEVALMTDDSGKTPLQYALSDKDTAVEVCNYFVKRGLDPALDGFKLLSPDKYEAEEGPMKTSLLACILNTGCLQFADNSGTKSSVRCFYGQ